MTEYKSFGEYLASLPEDTVFRIWEYKRMFTPYEQSMRFEDQSDLVHEECDHVYIKDVIILPDGDLLLKTELVECSDIEYYNFYKLSEIALALCTSDSDENADW